MMREQEQPQWRHISDIAVFTELLQALLESAIEQLETLKECEHRPHVLDEQSVSRYIALHTEQLDSHWLYVEQFARWKRGKLNRSQSIEVDRLIAQSLTLKAKNEEILALVEKIAPHTIERVMAVDDIELGIKALTKD